MSNNNLIIVLLFVYLLINILVAIYFAKRDKKNSFLEEYFIGNRSLGAFLLAMTIVGTYVGSSSFIGGPAIAYKLGLGWVLLASIQTPLVFFTLGILGKRLSIIGRKIKAVTIIDIIRYRYKNKFLVILLSVSMLIFLIASITAQFLGGARLFESILGIDYKIALTLFSFVIIIYTTYGGFKAASILDSLQSIVMVLSVVVLLVVLIYKADGVFNIMMKLKEIDPNLLTPTSNGNISIPFILSFWVLVGIGLLGLPATTIRAMAYKNTKSMHRAMLIGTVVIGFLMIGIHLVGVFGRSIDPSLALDDKIMPTLAIKHLKPIAVAIFLGGPIAAVMSSVDSILILASSTIVKDIYLNYINPKASEEKIKKISILSSLCIGIITYIIAFNPPSLIVWINLFALAGQEIIFFVPLIFGLYWDKGTDIAAICSVIISLTTYILMTVFKINIFGVHNVVYTLILSVLIYIFVSLLSYKKL